ncbi:MAG: hypothetical protein K6A33_10510 [Clostridiales bacterium]|nr:hypothetical protein [Clostridiales bacterium]
MRTITSSPAKKALLILLIVLAGLILLYALFCLIAPRFFYPEFFRYAEKVAVIPDLWGGFIPQGVTTASDGTTLICGYMPGDQPSRIYRLGGKPVCIRLEREDGTVYDGHAGGMTAIGDWIYISNASKIFVLKAEDVMNAKDGDIVRFVGHFEVPCRASFCSSADGMLFVGDFHADGYETDPSHVIQTSDGEEYAAMVFGYPVDVSQRFGVIEYPFMAFSVCDKVQGFSMPRTTNADPDLGFQVILSCSYGLADSEIKLYSLPSLHDDLFEQDGHAIPLYILDGRRLVKTVRIPHMSEDIEYRDGGLLVAFEAGAKKYGGGILPFSVRSVMKWNLPDFDWAGK